VQDVHQDRMSPDHAVLRHYPPDVRSVRAARDFVRQMLADMPEVATRAVMVVSELAGNAVLHADTSYSVCIGWNGRAVRGEVTDGSRDEPAVRPVHPGHGGRGLMIVDAMADQWGVIPLRDGKVVWFEIDPALDAGFPRRRSG
jgi:anti-sigma regulatory factor (Ser/Thr protein kinase)